MNYNDRWESSLRTLRFVKGEIALVNVPGPYFNSPCDVLEVGPFICEGCGLPHDYIVKLVDGAEVTVDDPQLKKFQPPADEKDESESETVTEENEVTA